MFIILFILWLVFLLFNIYETSLFKRDPSDKVLIKQSHLKFLATPMLMVILFFYIQTFLRIPNVQTGLSLVILFVIVFLSMFMIPKSFVDDSMNRLGVLLVARNVLVSLNVVIMILHIIVFGY